MRRIVSTLHIGRSVAIAALTGIALAAVPVQAQERLIPTPPVLLDVSLSRILQDAVEAVGRADWATAASLYREAIALAPEEAALHNNLGVIERRSGNIDAAIAAYQRAVDIDPTFGEVYPNLAIALLTTEQWQAALDAIALAGDSNVFEPLLPLYQAFAHEKLLQWEDAATAYEVYVQSEPNALGYYRGAIAHWQAGNGAAAARSFQFAARLDPAFPLYTSEAGLALATLDVDRSAVELLSRLPRSWTQAGDFVILARLAHEQGMSDLAEAAIAQALSSGSTLPAAWVSDAGVILGKGGRTEEASRYLERVANNGGTTASLTVESYGDSPQIRTSRALAIASANLADIYLQQSQPALALTASQSAIALDPLLPLAHNNFGVAAIALDRPNEAVSALEEAIVLDPDYWQAQRNLGFAYAHIGDRGRAREHLQKAMDVAPSLEQVQQLNQELLDLKRRELPAFRTDEERAVSPTDSSTEPSEVVEPGLAPDEATSAK